MPISNAILLDLDCSDITGWIDQDEGEAVSEQITFDTKSCFKFDSKTSADSADMAARYKEVGSVENLGNRIVVSLSLYCDAIGTRIDGDSFYLNIYRSDWRFGLSFATDGLFVYDGTTNNEFGTNLVSQDVWQEWTFDIDLSKGISSAVCDCYLDSILQASNIDCSWDIGGNIDGAVYTGQQGYSIDNRISYLDWLKIGDGFAIEESIIPIHHHLCSDFDWFGLYSTGL